VAIVSKGTDFIRISSSSDKLAFSNGLLPLVFASE
jgi:hypothetical protein